MLIRGSIQYRLMADRDMYKLVSDNMFFLYNAASCCTYFSVKEIGLCICYYNTATLEEDATLTDRNIILNTNVDTKFFTIDVFVSVICVKNLTVLNVCGRKCVIIFKNK
jgi:hypothetical protein